jgi:GcrA cell cycle regulator
MTLSISWTKAMVELLEKEAKNGLSAQEISVKLTNKYKINFSRNSVIGKAHRLKIKVGRQKLVEVKVKPQPVKKEIEPKPDLVEKKEVTHEDVKYQEGKFRNPLAISVKLLELKESQCRYPIGDVRTNDLVFCGAPVEIGKSTPYCSHCHGIVYYPSKYQAKKATELLQ